MTKDEIDYHIETKGGLYVATHAGKRYLDDICGVALFTRLGAEPLRVDRAERIRLNPKYLLFSTGGGKYDHHQSDKRYRENGVPYSSLGLVFKDFGAVFVGTYLESNSPHFDEVVKRFDSEIVQCIDAHVNGYPLGIYEFRWVIPAIAIVDKIDSEDDHAYVLGILEGCIRELASRIEVEHHVNLAIAEGGNGLMILDPGCSFIQTVRRYNISAQGIKDPMYLVVHPNETNWTLRCVPDTFNDHAYPLKLPVSWLTDPPIGCYNDKLTFVHKELWMATFDSKAHAVHAAAKLLELIHLCARQMAAL